MVDNPWLTTKQVSEILHVTEDTVVSYIKRKRDPLPARKPGKAYLIHVDRLNEWIDRQEPKEES